MAIDTTGSGKLGGSRNTGLILLAEGVARAHVREAHHSSDIARHADFQFTLLVGQKLKQPAYTRSRFPVRGFSIASPGRRHPEYTRTKTTRPLCRSLHSLNASAHAGP